MAAPFVNGADTDAAFFYRSSKVDFVAMTVVSVGSSATTNHPRNIIRYDIRPKGYTTTMALYSSHMKSGAMSPDPERRLIESQKIRDDAEALPADWTFILGGDFNIPSGTEAAYQELVGSQINNEGRFFDPINRSGNWGVSSQAVLHTQDPAGAGGMDDRFDQLLLSTEFFDGQGLEYIGNRNIPYSLSTWNDPNHSYRAWGNDGTSWNTTLRITNNSMVGAVIAQALFDSANGQGHLPVFLDLRVPPKVGTTGSLSFGKVLQGSKPVFRNLDVANTADTGLWTTSGISNLNYSIQVPSGFLGTVSAATAAAGATNTHEIVMDTRTPGFKTGNITVQTNDPGQPTVTIPVSGYVVPRDGRGFLP